MSRKTKEECLKNSISVVFLECFDKNAVLLIRNDYPKVLTEKWVEVIESSNIDLRKIWFASTVEEQKKSRIFRHRLPERVDEIVNTYYLF